MISSTFSKSLLVSEEMKHQISISNQTINISQLEAGSYVMIFDASGRNIYKNTLRSYGSVSVPIRNRGVYIIRIQNNKIISTQKILVK